ncbi:MAG: serine/threonine-protein phosphatase [Ardenticatenaceae bacterium]|nr:serine/threonine-protein phosphatase [Ardenticatenaceae bacterium]
MAEIISGYHYDIGGREVYEDRVNIQSIVTPGRLNLLVAVVADGVGGENKGERASQTAIDTLFQYLRSSTETDVPTLLINAVQAANQRVHPITRETGGASSTMAVAAVHEGHKLYIANVGDSRIYLCRDQALTQLSLDHTYANVMPWQGQISPDEARLSPRAEALMRAIGPRPEVPVDIGFYVNMTDPQVAHGRGLSGLPLREGDSILVCSDGLTKVSSRTGTPFTTPEEIVRVLNTQEGEKAARSLISFALGRNADDNVSAAVIQMPDLARHKRAQRPYFIIGGATVTILLVAAVIVYFLLQNQGRQQAFLSATATAEAISANVVGTSAAVSADEASALAAAVTGTAEAAATQTAVVAAYTPTSTPTQTPTATPRPTLIPNQIGVFFGAGEPVPFTLADSITTESEFVQLSLNNDVSTIEEDAVIFAQPDTQIMFENVTSDSAAEAGISLILYEGGDIFVETGDYKNGADISPIEDTRVSFLVSGSCMSVQYDPDGGTIAVACYDGDCRYRAEERDELTPLTRGNLLRYDVLERQPVETRRIAASDAAYYQNILLRSSAGRSVYNQCILPLFPPTPTPTATVTKTRVPTATPASSSGGDSSPSKPTSTPVPKPTSTKTASGSASLAVLPGLGAVGLTTFWLGLGAVLGLVLVADHPLGRKRP